MSRIKTIAKDAVDRWKLAEQRRREEREEAERARAEKAEKERQHALAVGRDRLAAVLYRTTADDIHGLADQTEYLGHSMNHDQVDKVVLGLIVDGEDPYPLWIDHSGKNVVVSGARRDENTFRDVSGWTSTSPIIRSLEELGRAIVDRRRHREISEEACDATEATP